MNAFSNDWWAWFMSTYSVTVFAIPSAIGFLLKLVAIFNPRIQTDKVIDLFKEYWPQGK